MASARRVELDAPPAVGHDRHVTRRTRLGLLALACVVGAIMALDIRARSRAPVAGAADPRPSSSPSAAHPPEVQRGLDKTPLVYPAQFVDQLVQRSRTAFVLADSGAGHAPVAGVLLGQREALLATGLPLTTWTLTLADGVTVTGRRTAADPVHGLVLLSLETDAPAPLTFGPAALTSGAPVVAVRPTVAALVTQLIPAPGTEASLAARLDGSSLAPGTVVIDLDGRIVAFFGAGVAGGVPLVATELETTILPALRAGAAPLLPWLGADLQAIDASLARHVGEGIAVITWVESGSPAAGAALAARDVVIDARLGGRSIATVEALRAALEPGLDLHLSVRRGRVMRAVVVPIARRVFPSGVSASTGVAVLGGDGPEVRVAPASPFAAAGLRSGDVVEAVDGRAVGAAALERTLRLSREVLITVRRAGTRLFVVLPASTEQETGT
jgi:hypothetical protein